MKTAALEQVLEAIRASGGIATLNHLYAYRLGREDEEALVRQFRDLGGQALEVVYSRYTPEQRERLMDYCQRFGLLPNCGSDRHTAEKPFQQGDGELFRRLRDTAEPLTLKAAVQTPAFTDENGEEMEEFVPPEEELMEKLIQIVQTRFGEDDDEEEE